jgi:hypothetical protein
MANNRHYTRPAAWSGIPTEEVSVSDLQKALAQFDPTWTVRVANVGACLEVLRPSPFPEGRSTAIVATLPFAQWGHVIWMDGKDHT